MKRKILTVIGARPQFIKAAPLSLKIKNDPELEEILVHTGQHFDKNMSDIFFNELQIPKPKYTLSINQCSHGEMTGRMLIEIEKILIAEKPDMVLVFGDTNSTLAGALAAQKLHIPVAHIESGLRSFNKKMPEEVNRIMTDTLSSILFYPSEVAEKNLNNEGAVLKGTTLINSGDIMLDACLLFSQNNTSTVLNDQNLTNDNYVLATLHRQENTDDMARLTEIIDALNTIHKNTQVVVPLHPRTKKIMESNNIKADFTIIEPVGYFDMIALIKGSKLVLTDSGGLQKEAYFLSKFCITYRDETEWIELVENGINQVTGAKKSSILEAFNKVINKPYPTNIKNIYGSGNTGELIVNTLKEWQPN